MNYPEISSVITASVLVGGFTMRSVVIYAGQIAQVIAYLFLCKIRLSS